MTVNEKENLDSDNEILDENTEELCDDVILQNFVFKEKYGSYEKLKKLRTQILACLATDDKEDKTGLVEFKQKNQMFLILALLVNMKFIEEKRGFQTKFMRQMNNFFPEMFPDPEAYTQSLGHEVINWIDKDGHIIPFGQWSILQSKMQKKKWYKFATIAEHIKTILQNALKKSET